MSCCKWGEYMGGFVVDSRFSSSNAPRFEEILAAFDDDISEVTIQTEVGHCTAKKTHSLPWAPRARLEMTSSNLCL